MKVKKFMQKAKFSRFAFCTQHTSFIKNRISKISTVTGCFFYYLNLVGGREAILVIRIKNGTYSLLG
jgi:hypothetical protein